MENFVLTKSSIDPQPFLQEIAGVDGAWGEATGRQNKIPVQREALAIPLRGLRKSAINGRRRRDVHESRWTSGSLKYPKARAFLIAFAEEQDCILGRAKIVCLPAGKRVYPHIDRGEYYRIRGRYHFVLRRAQSCSKAAGPDTSNHNACHPQLGRCSANGRNMVCEGWQDYPDRFAD